MSIMSLLLEIDLDTWIIIFWTIVSLGIALAGIMTLSPSIPLVPRFVRHLTLYGKFQTLNADDSKADSGLINMLDRIMVEIVKHLQIPKSCFRYFYIVSLMTTILIAAKNHGCSILIILQLIQSIRRLYETWKVSVFSPNNRINVVHFIIGILFYLSVAYATWKTDDCNHNRISTIILVAIFMAASIIQYQSHVILANIRRNHQTSANHRYDIPNGGLFRYVSCPHYLTEMIIYVCWWQFGNRTAIWTVLLLFVLINQTVASLMAHRWYRKTFRQKYPENIRAVIPFIF